MASIIRRQLTLFVDQDEAHTIEQVRQLYNPRQFELIKSHVTLCREDEIQSLDQVIANLVSLIREDIIIDFGEVVRFNDLKGCFLPAVEGKEGFQELRRKVLQGVIANPRIQEPHITLMHPRNSTCTDAIFELIQRIDFPARLIFRRISLIEQRDGGEWEVLRNFH